MFTSISLSLSLSKVSNSTPGPIWKLKMSRHPDVKWAERKDKVFLTVVLPDSKNPKINVDPNGTFTFSASAGTDNNLYELKLDLLDKINVEESKINIGVRSIFCVLEKAENKWWKKLLRGDEKTHYVKVDWDKWVDEDDETGGPGDLDFGGMDFSKFGDMGGLDDDAMGDGFDEDDDEEVKKPEEKVDGAASGESSESRA